MLSPLESLPFELLFLVLEMVMLHTSRHELQMLLRLDSVSQRFRAVMRDSNKGIWRKYQLGVKINFVMDKWCYEQGALLCINDDCILPSDDLDSLAVVASLKSKGVGSCVVRLENINYVIERAESKRTHKGFGLYQKLTEIISLLPPIVAIHVSMYGPTLDRRVDETGATLLSKHKTTIKAVHLVIECNQDVVFECLWALHDYTQLDQLTIQILDAYLKVNELLSVCIGHIRIAHLELDKVGDSSEEKDLILELCHSRAKSLALSGENLAFLAQNVCLPEVVNLYCRRWPSRKEWLWNIPTVLTNLNLLHIRNVSLGSEKVQKMFHLLSTSKAVFPSSIIICSKCLEEDEADRVVEQVINKWPYASVDHSNEYFEVDIADGRKLRLPMYKDNLTSCPCDLCTTKYHFIEDCMDEIEYSSDDYSDECSD